MRNMISHIGFRLGIVVFAVGLAIAGIGFVIINEVQRNAVEAQAIKTAESVVAQMLATRSVYTKDVVHPSLVADAPDLLELFRRWDFKESTLFVAEGCLDEAGGDFETAATCYLKREQAVWTQWVPTDVAQRVREALNVG
jgi:ABC-type proline/glycine betaine transport system substrate-binding protein